MAVLSLAQTIPKPTSPTALTVPRGSRLLFMNSLLKRLGACLALILCAVWYARSHTYRDPGSAFFDSTRAYDRRYSAYRLAETQNFIDSRAHQTLGKAGQNATMCVALTSVKRERTQYLETSIASLLNGLTQEERASLYLSVLIAETNPEKHPSWSQPWLREAVDDMHTYSVTPNEQAMLQMLEDNGSYKEKGVFDYVYALDRCYQTGAPFVGIFEDDIMMADGWFVRTLLGLRRLPPAAVDEAGEEKTGSWLFLRLFNQERSTGWAKRYVGGNNEHWICLGIGLAVTAVSMLARSQSRTARAYLDRTTVAVVVLVLNPALVILFFQSGKASMLPPAPGVFEEPFGCCSQALVFPRAEIPRLADYLREMGRGQVDLLLKRHAKKMGLARYSIYPVIAQHIGLDSARMTTADEAQAIWSMAYEDLIPAVLDRTHHAMVEEYGRLYGWP